MSDELQLTPEQKRNQLANLEREAKRIREELGGGVEDQYKGTVSDADLFANLSGQEKGQLARENPERFSQLATAFREQGEKKLAARTNLP